MAAPAHTAIGTGPSGIRIPEGFSSVMVFARAPTVSLWEIETKPPAIDGGDGIDITTQRNTRWHTMYPRRLLKLDAISMPFAYDPSAYNTIVNDLINQNGAITQYWPDGSYVDFWGFLNKFEPDALKEGEFPKASGTVTPSNYDQANKVEAPPVFVSVSGT